MAVPATTIQYRWRMVQEFKRGRVIHWNAREAGKHYKDIVIKEVRLTGSRYLFLQKHSHTLGIIPMSPLLISDCFRMIFGTCFC